MASYMLFKLLSVRIAINIHVCNKTLKARGLGPLIIAIPCYRLFYCNTNLTIIIRIFQLPTCVPCTSCYPLWRFKVKDIGPSIDRYIYLPLSKGKRSYSVA